jgi:uncharacterized protein YndB with AHSA1/START domain
MNHNLSVSESIVVNADVKKVWEALTNPAIIKDYLFGTETVTDWKVGSPVIFQGEYQGHKYKDEGVILENKPLELLSYSYWSGFTGLENKPENYSKVMYHVKAIDANTTQFTWTQKGFANETGYEHSKSGMTDFLKGIKAVMER